MHTLMIHDLPRTADLDRHAMATVRGGTGYTAPSCLPTYYQPQSCYEPKPYASPANLSFDVSQSLSQSQNTVNNNGNNVAWASGITSTVTPTQNGSNNITFG